MQYVPIILFYAYRVDNKQNRKQTIGYRSLLLSLLFVMGKWPNNESRPQRDRMLKEQIMNYNVDKGADNAL